MDRRLLFALALFVVAALIAVGAVIFAISNGRSMPPDKAQPVATPVSP